MSKKIKIIFTGESFYRESGSIMSPLYKETGERYDYGFLQRDLANGCDISIRQATPKELDFYKNKLSLIKAQDKNES